MLITLPLRRGNIERRPTSCDTPKIAVTFKLITLFQPSSVCSIVDAPQDVPALLTRMSIGPSEAMTCSTIDGIVARSPISQTSGKASIPSDFRCPAAASSSSRFRAVIATFAPSSPSTSAIWRPRPLDPPVTSATLPVRSCSLAKLISFSRLVGFCRYLSSSRWLFVSERHLHHLLPPVDDRDDKFLDFSRN